MQVWIERGAGLDVHKKTVVACWLDGQGHATRPVKRTFGTFQWQLEQLRHWLLENRITHVAMESTGVYWKPVYAVLEGSVEIVLGNARHMANVPGRKTDRCDAEWIATLLRHGLIRSNFVPPKPLRELRELTRYRRKIVQTRTSAENRVDKLLQTANIKFTSVASELFGVSGRHILKALAQGLTDAKVLAELSRGKLRNKRDQLEHALAGQFTAEHAQLLNLQLQMIERIELTRTALDRALAEKATPYEHSIALLDTAPGINRTIAIDVIAEIGTTLESWPSEHHLTAWAGLSPGNRESAGKRRQAKTREGNPYLKSILVQAATAAIKKRGSYLRLRYGRLCKRRGERRALVAIARELLVSIWYMLQRNQPYAEPAVLNPELHRERRKNHLLRQLQELGYAVTIV